MIKYNHILPYYGICFAAFNPIAILIHDTTINIFAYDTQTQDHTHHSPRLTLHTNQQTFKHDQTRNKAKKTSQAQHQIHKR